MTTSGNHENLSNLHEIFRIAFPSQLLLFLRSASGHSLDQSRDIMAPHKEYSTKSRRTVVSLFTPPLFRTSHLLPVLFYELLS